jgi:hypothetical protein
MLYALLVLRNPGVNGIILLPLPACAVSPVCCATPGLKELNPEIDNSIDPGVSGGLFLAEKRDGGTQGTEISRSRKLRRGKPFN